MTPEELSIFEKFNYGDLKILAALVSAIRDRVDTANENVDLALAKITNAMLLNTDTWEEAQKYQKVSAPTFFGVDNINGARGTHFIFGAYGFLGYQNNADLDASVVINPDYAYRTGQDIRDIEVVNRRTLQYTLAQVQNNIQGAFLGIDGGTTNTGSRYDFSKISISEWAEYSSLPNYANFKATSFANKGYVDSAISGALPSALAPYLLKVGTGIITGDLRVTRNVSPISSSVALMSDLAAITGDPIFTGEVVYRPEIEHLLDNPHIGSLKVEKTPTLPEDALRFQDIENVNVFPSKIYPIWTSGKIVLSPSPSVTRANSPYETELVSFQNQPNSAYYVKLLRIDGKAAWDLSDVGFRDTFTPSQRLRIEGADTSIVNSKLPFPIEYDLMLEYTVNPEAAVNGLWSKRSRLTVPIASSEEFKHSLFINDIGQLALLVQPGPVSVPWVTEKINVIGKDIHEPRFFVVVKKWSYCARDYKYPYSRSNSVYVGMDDVVVYANGAVTKSFEISIGGFDPDRTLNLVALDSDNVALIPNPTPLIGKMITIPFTATPSEQITVRLAVASGVDINGRAIDTSEILQHNFVTIRKRPISEALPLGLQNGDMVLKRTNGLPIAQMPFSFTPVVVGGVGPFEITVSNPVGTIVSYSPDTNLVSGFFSIGASPAPSFTLTVDDTTRPGPFSKVISATFPNENVI